MAPLTDEDRTARIDQLTQILARIDEEIAALQASRAPYAEALDSLTDHTADYEITLDHGDGRSLVVVQHGDSKDHAARLAMGAHPGFTANHAKTTAIPKDFPAMPLGPTIEEYVKAGYDPAKYPPANFAEVPSAGLTRYKAGGKVFQGAAPPSTPAGSGLLSRVFGGRKPEEPTTAPVVIAVDESATPPKVPSA